MEASGPWMKDWSALAETQWRRWVGASSAVGGPIPPGLDEAAATFARFAEEFGRLAQAQAAATDPAEVNRLRQEVERLAQRFFASALPAWPSWPGQGPEWVQALQTWSMVLADIARATATAFVERLQGPEPPATLRAAFDAWIDAAERAFQAAAHTEAFARAQAGLFNEFVRQRAQAQALMEQAARAAGQPTRSEIDGLHDEVRRLRAALAAAAPPAPVAAKAAAPRTRRKRRP